MTPTYHKMTIEASGGKEAMILAEARFKKGERGMIQDAGDYAVTEVFHPVAFCEVAELNGGEINY